MAQRISDVGFGVGREQGDRSKGRIAGGGSRRAGSGKVWFFFAGRKTCTLPAERPKSPVKPKDKFRNNPNSNFGNNSNNSWSS